MIGFGRFSLVKTNSRISDGRIVLNYNEILETRGAKKSRLKTIAWLIWANYCNFYIEGLRKLSNSVGFMNLMGSFERIVFKVFKKPHNSIASSFNEDGHFMNKTAIDPQEVIDFREFCKSQAPFLDVYNGDLESTSLDNPNMNLYYVKTHNILQYEKIFKLLCNPTLINTCKSILGEKCSITWLWLWFTKPNILAENQKWHRDSSEPFNFIRVFIPLTSIETSEHGPTEFIPKSHQEKKYIEPRRYTTQELKELIDEHGILALKSDIGDIYFANTFGIHRGTSIQNGQMRGMFSLLVSLHPSYRTPGIPKRRVSSLNEDELRTCKDNKNWLKHLIEW